MSDNYVIGMNSDMTLSLIHAKRNPEELASCVAVSTASWKTILRPGLKNYFNAKEHNIFDGRSYYLTYGRSGFSTVNPGLGDYVEPGFTNISMPLTNAIGEAATIISKGKFEPINGHKLINPTLMFKNDRVNTSVCINRGRPCTHSIPGWSIVHQSARSYVYMERAFVDSTRTSVITRLRVDDRYPDDVLLITQVLRKRFIQGATTIRIEVIGSPRCVLINDIVLTNIGNNVYEYNGPAFDCDVMIGIGVGPAGIRSVRVLDI